MRDINGTVTLAYLDEDNKQRVIFRVIPLCTREGGAFHGDADSFPDEGSLRVVPDKREQSTFKERMHGLGALCAIYLVSDGKELMKVRPNRNYSPDQGERNQYAIYSDVICEFTEDGCFEVVDAGASAGDALTKKVLIYKDKLLYGPVNKELVGEAELGGLKPFGNDNFLMHTIESPLTGKRRVYWNPEATISWRQRRNTMRKRDKAAEPATRDIEAAKDMQPQLAVAAEKRDEEQEIPVKAKIAAAPVKAAQQVKATPQTKPSAPVTDTSVPPAAAEAAAQAPAQQPAPVATSAATAPEAAPEARKHEPRLRRADKGEKAASIAQEQEEAIPIGSRLDILDVEMPFDAQIDRLAQPLSESANRLTDMHEIPEEESEEVVAHFTGTPLVPPAIRIKRSAARPDTVHRVVEQQLRGQRDEVMGVEIGAGVYSMVENPIDTLQSCVDYIWQNADMRAQAVDALVENESFMSDMLDAMRQSGLSLQAKAAAQEQLSEIEAERLSLLMQLEAARANESKFREEAIKSLNQKKRDESERLKREINELRKLKEKLSDEAEILSGQNSRKLSEYVSNGMTCMSGVGEQRILLTPVLGHSYTHAELAENLRIHMNDSGYSISEDDAMSLLINFSLYDSLCFRDASLEDANHFVKVLLESFGLQSVSAVLMPGVYVEMMSLLPEDARRAPTVTVQPLGTESMSVYGHKTIFLTDSDALPAEDELLCGYPIMNAPPLKSRASDYAEEWKPVAPASLASFASVRADAHPLMEEAEKWFDKLSAELAESELKMPEAAIMSMRRFIEVASRKVRGGFLAAADSAAAYWVAPMLIWRKADAARLASALAGLPHTLDILGIK